MLRYSRKGAANHFSWGLVRWKYGREKRVDGSKPQGGLANFLSGENGSKGFSAFKKRKEAQKEVKKEAVGSRREIPPPAGKTVPNFGGAWLYLQGGTATEK